MLICYEGFASCHLCEIRSIEVYAQQDVTNNTLSWPEVVDLVCIMRVISLVTV